MTVLLSTLLVSTLAQAGGEASPRGRAADWLVGPPLRVGSYAALRGGVTSAGGVEVSAQVYRRGRFGVDVGGTLTTLHRVDALLPWRHFNSYMLVADGVWAVSPTLHVGPSVGFGYRNFWQDWWSVGGSVMPTAGARAGMGLLTQRTWQFQLTARVAADLGRTRVVFDTAEVDMLNPFEVQLGARFVFARQRSPIVPGEERQ